MYNYKKLPYIHSYKYVKLLCIYILSCLLLIFTFLNMAKVPFCSEAKIYYYQSYLHLIKSLPKVFTEHNCQYQKIIIRSNLSKTNKIYLELI